MNTAAGLRRLIDAAAAPYRQAGRFAWHFARGKLAGDPVFVALLERGLIPDRAKLLDLGCGQGLLASWLAAADSVGASGDWPIGWPRPPRVIDYCGFELMPRDIDRARVAVGGRARFVLGDIRVLDYPPVDVVVVLDVLHYLLPDEQESVLARIRSALSGDGLLLLRVGDAAAGWRYRWSQWVDRCVTSCRGHRLADLHGRPADEWIAALRRHGFSVEAVPMSQGTPFANVLLIARVEA